MADSDALTNKFHGALKKLQLFILDFDAVALKFFLMLLVKPIFFWYFAHGVNQQRVRYI